MNGMFGFRFGLLGALLLGMGSAQALMQLPALTTQMLTVADTNQDGQVTFDEAKVLVSFLTPELFNQYDKNGDGVLTVADLSETPPDPGQILRQLLQAADTNQDGAVTFEEAQAVVPMLTQETFDRYDKNGDGVLSLADLADTAPDPLQVLRHLIQAADTNQDGQIEFAEAQLLYANLTLDQFNYLDRNDDGVLTQADLPDAPPEEPLQILLRLLNEADANGDAAVSFEEAQALVPVLTQQMFDYLDKNGDGLLTRDDFPAAPPDDPIRRFLNLLRLADANGDNALSYEEVVAVLPDVTQEAFDTLDRNDDGLLTFADLPEGPISFEELVALLRHADADENGEVTFEELQAVVPQITQDQFDWLDRNDDGVLSSEDLPAPPPENLYARILRFLQSADADGNGQLTLEELQAVVPSFTQQAFDYLDRNDDGVITAEDLPDGPPPSPLEMLVHLFRMADADNNGEVTLEELQALIPELTQEHFDRLDRSGDGVLSAADLPAFPEHPFEYILRVLRDADANGDSQVTFEELQALFPALTQEQFDRLDRNGDGVISVEDKPDAPVDPIERIIQLLQQADADGNKQVTFEELQAVFPELTQEQFDRLDRNDDGVISPEDLPEPPEDPRDALLQLFRQADADHNGELTFEEIQAVVPDFPRERFDQLDRNGDGVLSAADLPDGPIPNDDTSRLDLLHALVQADTDGDGDLDFAEIAAAFPNAPAELLGRIDTNGDWTITRAELRAALQFAIEGGYITPLTDIDASGTVDAMDIQVTINHALGRRGVFVLADINDDSRVDAFDIQSVINTVLGR